MIIAMQRKNILPVEKIRIRSQANIRRVQSEDRWRCEVTRDDIRKQGRLHKSVTRRLAAKEPHLREEILRSLRSLPDTPALPKKHRDDVAGGARENRRPVREVHPPG